MAKTEKNQEPEIIRPDPEAAARREQERRRQQKDRQNRAKQARALQAREVEHRLAEEREARAAARRGERQAALVSLLIRGLLVCALALVSWRAETKDLIDPSAMTWVICAAFAYLSFWLGDLARLYKEG